MKYFLEEISNLKDGTTTTAIWEKPTKKEAMSSLHMTLASAMVNPDVLSLHVEVKDAMGRIAKTEDYIAAELAEPEPMVEIMSVIEPEEAEE